MSVAQRIKELRKHLGKAVGKSKISQAELASRLGLTPTAVASWEQGLTEPSELNYLRLAGLIEGELSEFFARRAGVAPDALDYFSKTGQKDLGRHFRDSLSGALEARLNSLDERLDRIEKLLFSFLQEPASPGIRIGKAIRIPGNKHEKKRAQKP